MKYLISLFILLLLLGCDSINKNKTYAPLMLKGSESMHEVFSELAADFERLQDTLKVELEGGGSRTGLIAIKQRKADIGLSSFPFDLDSMLGKSHSVVERVVANDAIVVINHHENPITQLTNNQISNIYSGVIKDWSEIGGNPGKILPVVRDYNSGTQKFFTEHFKIFEVAPTAVVAGENHEIVDSVVSNKNGIGFIGYAYFTDMVKNIALPEISDSELPKGFVAPEPQFLANGSYPLKRSLRIYYNSAYDERVIAFLNYMESERAHIIFESFGLISTTNNF